MFNILHSIQLSMWVYIMTGSFAVCPRWDEAQWYPKGPDSFPWRCWLMSALLPQQVSVDGWSSCVEDPNNAWMLLCLFDKINFPTVWRSWTGLRKFLYLLKNPGVKAKFVALTCSCFYKAIYSLCNHIFPIPAANKEICHIRKSNRPHLKYSALQPSS